MLQPLVTIITPSLNQGRFIEQTIRSVLDQNYPRIEHWIVDGGSTDDTVEILQRFKGRIRWISEPDGGQSDALNKGLERASGNIIGWLNSDDLYLPGAVATAVRGFAEHPDAVMVYGDGFDTDIVGQERRPCGVQPYDLWRLIHCRNLISQPSAFVKREALVEAGGLDANLDYVMDWDLWIRLGLLGEAVFVPAKLSCNRSYVGNKVTTGGFRRWRESHRLARRYGEMRFPYASRACAVETVMHRIRRLQEQYGTKLGTMLYRFLGLYVRRQMLRGSGVDGDAIIARTAHVSLPNLERNVEAIVAEITPAACGVPRIRVDADGQQIGTLKGTNLDLAKDAFSLRLRNIPQSRPVIHFRLRLLNRAAPLAWRRKTAEILYHCRLRLRTADSPATCPTRV